MGLLERGSARAALGGYAQDAGRGDGRLVLVAGEAGVGKSALVEQLAADRPGARWLWGACDGLFTPRPLGPLFDLADQLGGELLALDAAGAGRDELFRALLRQLGEPGTLTVAVIEDVHWADEATIDWRPPIRCGWRSGSWPPSGRPGGSGWRRYPRGRSGSWPREAAWSPPPCTG